MKAIIGPVSDKSTTRQKNQNKITKPWWVAVVATTKQISKIRLISYYTTNEWLCLLPDDMESWLRRLMLFQSIVPIVLCYWHGSATNQVSKRRWIRIRKTRHLEVCWRKRLFWRQGQTLRNPASYNVCLETSSLAENESSSTSKSSRRLLRQIIYYRYWE